MEVPVLRKASQIHGGDGVNTMKLLKTSMRINRSKNVRHNIKKEDNPVRVQEFHSI